VTQPSFVPVVEADQVRRAYQLQVPSIWTTSRPSELRGTHQPSGTFLGTPGPDQGFALKLARRFEDRLELGAGEQAEDAIWGCTAVAMRRAAAFGRAPVIHDLTLAFTLWGFLGGSPDDLVAAREPLFRAASHHYQVQRTIADCVRDSTLRLTPEQVADRLAEWPTLLELPDDH
jgi:alkanesulfonate monooxygenase SsuD/methylene tetrahydromethanopterin reductase-like flavin-dependent oxidoreductase (luciferase family)